MSEIKIIKKSEVVETRLINNGSAFKRFGVVRVGGKNAQSFRAWFDTFGEAEQVANEYANGQHKGLYFILEVQAGLGMPGEFDRKLPDIEHNHFTAVKQRKAVAESLEHKAAERRAKRALRDA